MANFTGSQYTLSFTPGYLQPLQGSYYTSFFVRKVTVYLMRINTTTGYVYWTNETGTSSGIPRNISTQIGSAEIVSKWEAYK